MRISWAIEEGRCDAWEAVANRGQTPIPVELARGEAPANVGNGDLTPAFRGVETVD
jgi:hypothetical protein